MPFSENDSVDHPVSIYAATKAFVTSFTVSLYEEYRKSGIKVLGVCPGYTKTATLFHPWPCVPGEDRVLCAQAGYQWHHQELHLPADEPCQCG